MQYIVSKVDCVTGMHLQEGKTPLFTAALLGNQEIVEMLLEMDQVNQKLAIAQPKVHFPGSLPYFPCSALERMQVGSEVGHTCTPMNMCLQLL